MAIAITKAAAIGACIVGSFMPTGPTKRRLLRLSGIYGSTTPRMRYRLVQRQNATVGKKNAKSTRQVRMSLGDRFLTR
jgi:hypothetical protein